MRNIFLQQKKVLITIDYPYPAHLTKLGVVASPECYLYIYFLVALAISGRWMTCFWTWLKEQKCLQMWFSVPNHIFFGCLGHKWEMDDLFLDLMKKNIKLPANVIQILSTTDKYVLDLLTPLPRLMFKSEHLLSCAFYPLFTLLFYMAWLFDCLLKSLLDTPLDVKCISFNININNLHLMVHWKQCFIKYGFWHCTRNSQ